MHTKKIGKAGQVWDGAAKRRKRAIRWQADDPGRTSEIPGLTVWLGLWENKSPAGRPGFFVDGGV